MAWTEFTRAQHLRRTKRYPGDLTDAEWKIVRPLLPGRNHLGRSRQVKLRRVWNAIQYLAAAGCAWSLLPRGFPPVSTVRYYFYRRRDDGQLAEINRALVAAARLSAGRGVQPTVGVIDSQSVKTPENTSLSGYDAGMPARRASRPSANGRAALAVVAPQAPHGCAACGCQSASNPGFSWRKWSFMLPIPAGVVTPQRSEPGPGSDSGWLFRPPIRRTTTETVHQHADLALAAGPVSDNIHMISFDSYRRQWLSNIRGDLLAGLVVALALIPEAIAFSIIAGVDPKVGLYASFSIAVIVAITGGRPGMISAATAATAVLMVTLVRDHGLQYLLAATVLAGLIQIGAGLLKLGFVMRYVSKSVMTGFVNALAILIFMAQLPELDPRNVTWLTYVLVAAGLAIIYLFPLVTKAIPSPLVTIVVLSALTFALGLDVRTVGDMGALPDTLPVFLIPQIPLSLETFLIILPYSVAVAVVGLLESLMTQNIVDDLTDTKSDRSQECIGQGIANTATGFIGGMAGCAMIGQSIINVKSGGRGRLSSFAAGVFLLIMVVGLGDLVSIIPMAALVAIMIMVSIGTFSWSSIKALRVHPRSSSVVMIATVVAVVYTHNLAIGVLVGVLLSGIFFAGKIAQLFRVTSEISPDGRVRTYRIEGQLFYGSVEDFMEAFDFREAP
ncbi:MAG: transposase, partial [Defluviimonas sp.]|nr:transposase [Defluviimonas sp.]